MHSQRGRWERVKNYRKAAQSYQKACDLNKGLGCSSLGLLYENGYGVKQNCRKAKQLYQKACSLGISFGCKQLKKFQ